MPEDNRRQIATDNPHNLGALIGLLFRKEEERKLREQQLLQDAFNFDPQVNQSTQGFGGVPQGPPQGQGGGQEGQPRGGGIQQLIDTLGPLIQNAIGGGGGGGQQR